MPLLLDNIRAEFARHLSEDPHARFRMDAALAHVATIAYQRGLLDGRRPIPASAHTPAECSAAFEWLRTEATKEGASEHAGVALDELHALTQGACRRVRSIPGVSEDLTFRVAVSDSQITFDLVEHLHRQREFSERTFGPGTRTAGVLDHIRKELKEIERESTDLSEWIDVVLLALDGAWRQGYTPEQIVVALEAKQTKNEGRQWPDWRTAEPGKAIEHVRDEVTS